MIKEEFIQDKILQQQADMKAFITVFRYLNQKVGETEKEQQNKLRAYKDNSSLKFEIMAKQLYVASQRVL